MNADVEYVDCRCPECNHIRAQAANGSQLQVQCPQCRIKFCVIIRQGKVRVTHQFPVGSPAGKRKRKRVMAVNPPTLVG